MSVLLKFQFSGDTVKCVYLVHKCVRKSHIGIFGRGTDTTNILMQITTTAIHRSWTLNVMPGADDNSTVTRLEED